MPLVSVAIATYNRAPLVGDAIRSVLDQSVADLEVILIDDGSTDSTADTVHAFADPRIRYVRKENGGCASARNAGLALCRGRFIAFLDSDDLWPANFLEALLTRLRDGRGLRCGYGPVLLVDMTGEHPPLLRDRHCRCGRITAELFRHSFVWLQSMLIPSQILQGFAFDESLANAADTDAILRLSTRCEFLYVPEARAVVRMNHGVSPREHQSAWNCNRIRVLERFYYRLGGSRHIGIWRARCKLSHAYRSVARNYLQHGCRAAAVQLYVKALRYLPTDPRLYRELVSAWRLPSAKDTLPEWTLPDPLPDVECDAQAGDL